MMFFVTQMTAICAACDADRGHLGDEEHHRRSASSARLAQALALRLVNRRSGDRAGGSDVRAQTDLREAGARRRDGPAAGSVRAPRATVVRVLRPPPDGAADV